MNPYEFNSTEQPPKQQRRPLTPTQWAMIVLAACVVARVVGWLLQNLRFEI